MEDHAWSNSGRGWESGHVQDREGLHFDKTYAHYPGSATEYQEEHASRYGGLETLAPDGRHVKADGSDEPNPSFPRGSPRERDHRDYDASTQPRNRTRRAYDVAHAKEVRQFNSLPVEQQVYYAHNSGGLVPSAHARLIPHARRFDEISNDNAKDRLAFLDKHGNVAYHTLEDDKKHRDWAAIAVDQHARAHQARVLHNENRPRPHDPKDPEKPKKLDCYGNVPVWNHGEHTRSRSRGLPPPNTYCSRQRTPSASGSNSEDDEPRPSNSQKCKPTSGGKRGRPRGVLLIGNPGPLGGGEYSRR